jgi:hypothetical protein
MDGPRMMKWSDWEQVIMPLFGKIVTAVDKDKSNKVSDGNQDEASDGGEHKDEYTDILGNLTLDTNLSRYNSINKSTTKKHPLSSISMNRSIMVPAKNSMSHDLYTDCNYKPLSSIRDAKELQHGIDLLYPSQEPLTPESIATIISGSYSLMNNDDDIDIIKRQSSTALEHQLTDNKDDEDSSSNSNDITTTTTTYEQKKKLLEGQSDKRRMEYKKKMEDNQREEGHQTDEADGVNLFRRAYTSWFKKEKKDKSSSSSSL